ncbi:MAG: hypothetical protein ACBZ72_06380 [Candidatus Bathyarchaeia archaeon]
MVFQAAKKPKAVATTPVKISTTKTSSPPAIENKKNIPKKTTAIPKNPAAQPLNKARSILHVPKISSWFQLIDVI